MPGSSPGMTCGVGVVLRAILDTLIHIATCESSYDAHPTYAFRTILADTRRPRTRPIRPRRLPVPVQKHRLPVFRLRQAEHPPLRHHGGDGDGAPAGRLRSRMGQGLRDDAKGNAVGSVTAIRSWTTLPVLGYGDVWQRGGFTCKSEQTGVTCFNADRRGFSLARAKQEVF